MGCKTGIYITGLGNSLHKESVEKYSQRLLYELCHATQGIRYELKTENLFYLDKEETTCVTISRLSGAATEPVYKIYEFAYHDILTEKFKKNNILVKSLILSGVILKKIPQLILRIFVKGNFSRPYQTFYALLILLIISSGVVFLIPACIDMLLNISFTKEIARILPSLKIDYDGVTYSFDADRVANKLKVIGESVLPLITFLLLVVPESRTIATTMAIEFVCVDRYISHGNQVQCVRGKLELLIDFVSEREPDTKLHFHCYSFGCLIAIDSLFPIGSVPSNNTTRLVEGLVTTGNPYEFIRAYYPSYFISRCFDMDDRLSWINIYSTVDALGTNFRKDSNAGDPEFGIGASKLLPSNVNYEITPRKKIGLLSGLSLYSISVHKCYWDADPTGASCLRLLLAKMIELKYLEP